MAKKIVIEDIQKQLSEQNWKVLSGEYINLETPMMFECPEGHQVTSTWKKLRAKPICPICDSNPFIQSDEKIVPKTCKCRVLALDQASHDCGWSVFDDGKLVKYGIYTVSNRDETTRISRLKEWLISMISIWRPDYIGIEGIQYQEESHDQSGYGKNKMGITVFQTLARLQGVLMNTCYELKIPFEICPTNTWRNHCGVKGKSRPDRKKSMQLIAKKWYDISVTNDEADAIGIGKYLSDKLSKISIVEEWA